MLDEVLEQKIQHISQHKLHDAEENKRRGDTGPRILTT
jgi:hypothetical protein